MVLLESSRDNRVQGINEIVLINDLNQQGLSVLAIAQQVGYDRKTVKKYIERSLEARYDGLRAA
jgi:transposase